MPKTKMQNVLFTLMMAFVMVYAMICYNIALNLKGMSNQVFLIAFQELWIMWPTAFLLEFFVVERAAKGLALRFVRPEKDSPIMVMIGISAMIVCLMCPAMSLVATVLFKDAGREGIAIWIQTTVMNFPMAFFWQMAVAGPLVRFIFGKIVR